MPDERHVEIFGVSYTMLRDASGDEMFLTEYGLPLRASLDPVRWMNDGHLTDKAKRLPGGTGSVFLVPVTWRGRTVQLVVKYARTAQHMPLAVLTTMSEGAAAELIAHARFNSPFEEFGRLMALRRWRSAVGDGGVLTKRPLAIFCPSTRYEAWRLGRSATEWSQHEVALMQEQHAEEGQAVHLHSLRDYLLIYGWVRGADAQEFCERGLLDENELIRLTRSVDDNLAARGYRVIDHKPRHLVLRQRRDGSLLRRRGRLVYALIDFELLEPMPVPTDAPTGT